MNLKICHKLKLAKLSWLCFALKELEICLCQTLQKTTDPSTIIHTVGITYIRDSMVGLWCPIGGFPPKQQTKKLGGVLTLNNPFPPLLFTVKAGTHQSYVSVSDCPTLLCRSLAAYLYIYSFFLSPAICNISYW